jgi:hypothetical protein
MVSFYFEYNNNIAYIMNYACYLFSIIFQFYFTGSSDLIIKILIQGSENSSDEEIERNRFAEEIQEQYLAFRDSKAASKLSRKVLF